MAQASSAHREPSMEEILSSIRRIIEDSDAGAKPAAQISADEAPVLADPPSESVSGTSADASAASKSDEPADAEVADTRTIDSGQDGNEGNSADAGVPPVQGALQSVERTPVQQTSLAEIQARIAADNNGHDSAPTDNFAPAAELSETPKMPTAATLEEDTASGDDGVSVSERLVAEVAAAMATDHETAIEDTGDDAAEAEPAAKSGVEEEWLEEFSEPEPEIDEVSNDHIPELAGDESGDTTEIVTAPAHIAPVSGPILSPEAERQVAASFEELSKAFISSRAESYDKMAEELLRPMLQDWLDNNLPTLVERLVREEIERVARSGSAK